MNPDGINHRIHTLIGSTTLAITAKAKQLRAQGVDVINFAGGEPDFDTPDPIKEAAIKAIHDGLTKYTPSAGLPQLREIIAEVWRKRDGVSYSPDDIVVSCGAKHALYNVIQVLVDEGDEVIIPAPYWVSYPEMVKAAGGKPVIIPTDAPTHFKLVPEQLEAHCTKKTRAIILNSPSNPTGMVYTKQECEALVEVCLRHNLWIISDEIYNQLYYIPQPPVSIAALSDAVRERTITVNGVSKAYAMTGWRIGYAGGPSHIMSWVRRLQDHSTSNPCSISQAAAMAALQLPDEIVARMRTIFHQRCQAMLEGARQIPGLTIHPPQGAFYCWCDIKAWGQSQSVTQSILETIHIAFIPGDGFGMPGFARLSFATSDDQIKAGLHRLAVWASQHLA